MGMFVMVSMLADTGVLPMFVGAIKVELSVQIRGWDLGAQNSMEHSKSWRGTVRLGSVPY
jgi:hypothetical protein